MPTKEGVWGLLEPGNLACLGTRELKNAWRQADEGDDSVVDLCLTLEWGLDDEGNRGEIQRLMTGSIVHIEQTPRSAGLEGHAVVRRDDEHALVEEAQGLQLPDQLSDQAIDELHLQEITLLVVSHRPGIGGPQFPLESVGAGPGDAVGAPGG